MNMSPKEALKEIRNLFATFSDAEKKEFALTEGKLVDGTVVFYDLETKEIYVAGADGEKVPAPVGEHELETGEIVVVTEEGKIAEIKKKDDEPTVEVEVEAAEEEKTDDTKDAEKEDMKKQIEKMQKDYEEMKKKVDEMSANFETLLKTQKMSADIIEVLAKEPSAEPIQKPNTFHQQLKTSKQTNIEALQKVFEQRSKQFSK
jgi:hypothetical protein